MGLSGTYPLHKKCAENWAILKANIYSFETKYGVYIKMGPMTFSLTIGEIKRESIFQNFPYMLKSILSKVIL